MNALAVVAMVLLTLDVTLGVIHQPLENNSLPSTLILNTQAVFRVNTTTG